MRIALALAGALLIAPISIAQTDIGVSPARAEKPSANARLKALEKGNTERQRTKIRKVSKAFSRTGRAARAGNCTPDALIIKFNSGTAAPANAQLWLTIDIGYANDPQRINISLRPEGSATRCTKGVDAVGNGSVQTKMFCALSIDEGAQYLLELSHSTAGPPCDKIISAEIESKMVNVEAIEPE